MKHYYERKFAIMGVKGIYRKRVKKNRGYVIQNAKCFIMIHFGKRTLMVHKRNPSKPFGKTWMK